MLNIQCAEIAVGKMAKMCVKKQNDPELAEPHAATAVILEDAAEDKTYSGPCCYPESYLHKAIGMILICSIGFGSNVCYYSIFSVQASI